MGEFEVKTNPENGDDDERKDVQGYGEAPVDLCDEVKRWRYWRGKDHSPPRRWRMAKLEEIFSFRRCPLRYLRSHERFARWLRGRRSPSLNSGIRAPSLILHI